MARFATLAAAAGATSALHAQTWSGMTCLTGSWTTSECWCTDCSYPNASNASAEIQLGEPSIGPGLGIQLLGLSTQTGGSVMISGDLLYYGSAITNSGQIRILGGRILPLGTDSPFTLTLGGPGRLVLDGAPAFQAGNIVNLYGTTLINTQSHTIAGRGALAIRITNNGTIDATGDLVLKLYDITNTGGLLKSSAAAGRLRIAQINCTGGLLQADAGVINLVSSTLHNATLRPGEGELTIGDYLETNYTATSAFDAVTLNGNTRVIYRGELDIPNPCTNNGIIHIDADGQLRLLLPAGALVGTGSVVLEPSPNPLGGGVLRGNSRGIGAGQTIRGSGTITYGLENLGTILADVPGKDLLLTTDIAQPTSQYLNQGTIGATSGGKLRLEDIRLVQMFGGTLRADGAGSRIMSTSCTIDGGGLATSAGGIVEASTSNTWGHGLTIQANVTVSPGTLQFFGVPIANLPSATIDGQVTVAGAENPIRVASVELPPDGLLLGSGSIVLAAPSESALNASRVIQYDGASTIGPDLTIRGTGQFSPGNTTLQGSLRAEGAGRSLLIAGGYGQFWNTGTLAAATGATLVIQNRVVQNAGGRLSPESGTIRLVNSTIVGGLNQGTGWLETPSGYAGTLAGVVNQGTIAVRAGSSLYTSGAVQNDGIILVNPDAGPLPAWLDISGTPSLVGTGELRLLAVSPDSGLQLQGATLVNGVAHTILGSSRIAGSIDSSGRLSTIASAVPLTIDGSLTLRPTSRVHIDLLGASSARIAVGTSAAIGGSLEVVQNLPTSLPTGTTFTLLTSGQLTGTFGSTTLPAPGPGQRFTVVYTPTAVQLRVSRAADFNGDGSLSVQDIFDFLNAWFAGSPTADFNQSGGLSVQDIFDFLNAWFAG